MSCLWWRDSSEVLTWWFYPFITFLYKILFDVFLKKESNVKLLRGRLYGCRFVSLCFVSQLRVSGVPLGFCCSNANLVQALNTVRTPSLMAIPLNCRACLLAYQMLYPTIQLRFHHKVLPTSWQQNKNKNKIDWQPSGQFVKQRDEHMDGRASASLTVSQDVITVDAHISIQYRCDTCILYMSLRGKTDRRVEIAPADVMTDTVCTARNMLQRL